MGTLIQEEETGVVLLAGQQIHIFVLQNIFNSNFLGIYFSSDVQ
jgi:hypothetical protein